MGGSGSYNQQLCEASQFLPCLSRTVEHVDGQYGSLADYPSQAELPTELPGQTRLPAQLCRWSELLAGFSPWVTLQAWLKESYVATWVPWLGFLVGQEWTGGYIQQ